VRTAARVASETPGFPFSTRLTVASLTPTFFATSASRRVMASILVQVAQEICGNFAGSLQVIEILRKPVDIFPRQ
jgi:hypothetical protein